MFRILLVTLLFLAAAAPVLAGPQERANALFVEAVKLIQAGNQEQDPGKRLEQLAPIIHDGHRIWERRVGLAGLTAVFEVDFRSRVEG